jgi:hypothetical protein
MAKGYGGSGIFGGVFTGIVCDSKDNSAYCSFTKIVSVIINLFIVGMILYFAYQWLNVDEASLRGRLI